MLPITVFKVFLISLPDFVIESEYCFAWLRSETDPVIFLSNSWKIAFKLDELTV